MNKLLDLLKSYGFSLFYILLFEMAYILLGYKGNSVSIRKNKHSTDTIPCPYFFLSKIYKTLDGALEARLITLKDGEYASIIVWKSMEEFLDVLNRDVRLIDVLRPHVKVYDDGEEFHAFSGPSVDLSSYN